jgi:hypothetical protein
MKPIAQEMRQSGDTEWRGAYIADQLDALTAPQEKEA